MHEEQSQKSPLWHCSHNIRFSTLTYLHYITHDKIILCTLLKANPFT